MSEDEIFLSHLLQCRPIDLALTPPVLTAAQQEQFDNYKLRRGLGEPLQYILGTCNFMGLELAVNPSVLVPRPETEQLVDAALKHFKAGRVLDLGTGSGNIAIALAKFAPQSQIVSVDISVEALELAIVNARRHKVEDRIQFIYDDLLVTLRQKPGDLYDLIISNPPYIPTSQLKSLPREVQKEPALALDGGTDGLNFYRIIIKYTPCLLRKGACLMMEFGDGQAQAVKKLIEDQGVYSGIEIIQDLTGRDRIVKAIK
jgi:release factor glutamine methyltransferase